MRDQALVFGHTTGFALFVCLFFLIYDKLQLMKWRMFFGMVVLIWAGVGASPCIGASFDIRGPWIGNAKGSIFGAEGSVTITHQRDEDIQGLVEGGNFMGKAKFYITGKIRGNHIFGEKDGHTFQGFLYSDGTIRGLFRAINGDTYRVFLQRPYSYWGIPPSGIW